MPKVMLTTPYPTIEETARLLGISAKERDEIVARVAVKAEAARGALRAAQEPKPQGSLSLTLPRASRAQGPKPQGSLGVTLPRASRGKGSKPGSARERARGARRKTTR